MTAYDFLSVCCPQLKELPSEAGCDDDEGGSQRRMSLKFGCVMQLCFPHHGQTTRGAAVAEDSFTFAGEYEPGLVLVCAVKF